MMLSVTEQEFDVLKARYQKWKDGGFIDVDTIIIPILEMFDSISGLVSIYSCSGHPDTGDADDESMFFILAVKEGCQDMIHDLFRKINNEAIKTDLFNVTDYSPFRLSVNYRPWPIGDNTENVMYYSWVMSFDNITTLEKQQLAFETYMKGCAQYREHSIKVDHN